MRQVNTAKALNVLRIFPLENREKMGWIKISNLQLTLPKMDVDRTWRYVSAASFVREADPIITLKLFAYTFAPLWLGWILRTVPLSNNEGKGNTLFLQLVWIPRVVQLSNEQLSHYSIVWEILTVESLYLCTENCPPKPTSMLILRIVAFDFCAAALAFTVLPIDFLTHLPICHSFQVLQEWRIITTTLHTQ